MFNEFISNNATLIKLIENENYRNSFSEYYIPNIELINDEKKFINSSKIIIEDNSVSLIKFILIDKNGKVTSDSTSQFIELLNDGYIARLIVPRPWVKENVGLSYIVDINNILLLKMGDIIDGQIVYKYEFDSMPIYLGSKELTDNTVKLLANNDELFKKFIEPIK